MPYYFPASMISAVAGRNKNKNWKDAAAEVVLKQNMIRYKNRVIKESQQQQSKKDE